MRNSWIMQSKCFNKELCENLVSNLSEIEPEIATTLKNEAVSDYRKSTVRWVNDKGLSDMIYNYVKDFNLSYFGVEVTDHAEIQFTEYSGSESGEYKWHHDVDHESDRMSDRKLSVVIQLTDPSEYEGCDLCFDEVQNPNNNDLRAQGTIIVFPSFLRHCVTPITKGTRHSLVLWYHGPRWK